jgi:hypothetical protein
MKAQELYDFREATGFVSGMDLHGFFLSATGDMSPSGKVEIDPSIVSEWMLALADDPCMAGAAAAYHLYADDELNRILKAVLAATSLDIRDVMRAKLAARRYSDSWPEEIRHREFPKTQGLLAKLYGED